MKILIVMTALLILFGCSGPRIMKDCKQIDGDFYECREP